MSKKSTSTIIANDGENVWDIEAYLQLVREKKKVEISKMIYHRIFARYLKPFTFSNKTYTDEYKNGFSIIANCCLCIETIQSFKNGWGETPKGEGQVIFEQFFKSNDRHKDFLRQNFYKNIRCGVLHQGESAGGWKILRTGKLIDGKTINSVKFLNEVILALENYRDELETSEWDSEIWDNFRIKMKKILANCKE